MNKIKMQMYLNETSVALDAAREYIDGKMNCNTPEYEAMNHLWHAIDSLAQSLIAANPSDGTRGER